MNKQNLLIIDKTQFGYLTDAYYWCKYLRDEYEIHFLCFDDGRKKISMNGVFVHYISYKGSKVIRGIRYIISAVCYILFFRGTILVEYFEHSDILRKVFPNRKMLLDIRTLSISPDKETRLKWDNALFKTCAIYDKITAISEGVKNKIAIANISVLPLGAETISNVKKSYSKMRLLYVGTFSGRQIDKTILGVSIFHKLHPDIDFTYDIVGFGYNGEDEQLKNLVKELNLCDYINFYGKVPNTELKPFLDRNNIGVSFVPITDYYNYQPPTKTFEYVLSGLFTIATATIANKELINANNGILIKDTSEDFARAMEEIHLGIIIDDDKVRRSLEFYSWKNIVETNLKPILSSI